jgi:hypothetical protein
MMYYEHSMDSENHICGEVDGVAAGLWSPQQSAALSAGVCLQQSRLKLALLEKSAVLGEQDRKV